MLKDLTVTYMTKRYIPCLWGRKLTVVKLAILLEEIFSVVADLIVLMTIVQKQNV